MLYSSRSPCRRRVSTEAFVELGDRMESVAPVQPRGAAKFAPRSRDDLLIGVSVALVSRLGCSRRRRCAAPLPLRRGDQAVTLLLRALFRSCRGQVVAPCTRVQLGAISQAAPAPLAQAQVLRVVGRIRFRRTLAD